MGGKAPRRQGTKAAGRQGGKAARKYLGRCNRLTRRLARIIAVSAAALLLGALPPRTARSSTASLGRVVWHDLVTRDLDASKRFYSGLFGWTWRAPTSGHGIHYIVGEMAGVAVAGLAESHSEKVGGGQWLAYFEVDNVKNTVRDAVKAGGRVVIEPTHTAYQGESAVLLDPEGAPFAVMRAHGDTASVPVALNSWLWNELWTRNKEAASDFYGGLIGYQQREVKVAGASYSLLELDSVPRAGLITIPVPDIHPNWLPTIRVADVKATVSRAVSLGGRVIMAPRDDVRHGTVAIIADPQGAAFVVQQWPAAMASAP
jgi:uncharacterized protein